MSRLLKVSTITLATSLALAGCATASAPKAAESVSVSAQAPEPAVAPATGTKITGTGYSFVVPEGWDRPGENLAQEGIDTIAADLKDTDGFSDNINVLLSPAGKVTPKQVESQGLKELEDSGAKDAKKHDRVTIGDSESAHLSALFPSEAGEYQIEQFYVSSKEQTYVVTFSFSPSVSEADRDALSNSVLATWSWT